jgi:hypothetical protein
MYGGSVDTTMMRWFYLIHDFVYTNSDVLRRSRNLTGANHLTAILEELHGATLRNTRFTAAYTPTMNEAKFIYLTTCTISPRNADGAICRYLMDLEATQGLLNIFMPSFQIFLDIFLSHCISLSLSVVFMTASLGWKC